MALNDVTLTYKVVTFHVVVTWNIQVSCQLCLEDVNVDVSRDQIPDPHQKIDVVNTEVVNVNLCDCDVNFSVGEKILLFQRSISLGNI